MKRLVHFTTILGLLTIFSGQVFAAGDDKLYLGIGLARGSVSDAGFDDSDNNFNVLLGWMFNKHFGLEGGYYY